MATAPGLNERPVLLPLTLSLSDSETKLFVRSRASAARPILFLFSTFLFSDNAAPATNGRQALFLFSDIRGTGDRWPSRRSRCSWRRRGATGSNRSTAGAAAPQHCYAARIRSALKDQQKRASVYLLAAKSPRARVACRRRTRAGLFFLAIMPGRQAIAPPS